MSSTVSLDRAPASPFVAGARRARRERVADDKAMLKAASELTRDLHAAKPAIYWADLLGSAGLGYGALAAAMLLPSTGWAIVAAVVAVFALYRASLFIHEISHMKHAALPGFKQGWNAVVGVPLMVPSFMYEGVHNLHHAKTRYGTVDDPEYLPLALMKPWTVPLFVLVSALAPIGFLIRYALLAPLSYAVSGLRKIVVERFSSLAINPEFRRRLPDGEAAREFTRLELAASAWTLTLLALVATGVVPLRVFAIFLAVISAIMVVNQVRTLVAHLWENEGEQMSVTAQYLDSVNVPPPSTLPALWAPVGLRYHALHHLLPGVPYHSLGEAHRRISAALEPGSHYHKASHKGLPGLLGRLIGSTMGR